EASAVRLWTSEGRNALEYLRGRGLTNDTICAARLGWTSRARGVPWNPPSVVIPWFVGDRLALVKIRPHDEWRASFPKERRPPKYIEAFRDCPTLYPAASVIRPGKRLIIPEGELETLLLGQDLGELAAVLTLGSASARPEGAIYLALLPAPAWYIATDA